MFVYGQRINYDGDLGALPVIQAGRYKVLHLRTDYEGVPFALVEHIVDAIMSGAQFLVIDSQPLPVKEEPNFINLSVA